MISADGWFDWAMQDRGPVERMQWGQGWTAMDCICHHSLEGGYTPITGYTPLRDPNRFPTAWHGTIKRNGIFWQHYPVFVRLQHGNSANTRGPGFESEGVAGEPLTPEQVATWRRIHKDIAAFTGKTYTRIPGSQVGLVEHREMTVPPGGTACPSGRYAPLWAALEGEEGLSVEDKERLARLEAIVAGNGVKVGDNFLTGDAALDHIAAQKASAFASIQEIESPSGWVATSIRQARAEGEAANAKIAAHEDGHTVPIGVGDHEHTDGQSGPVKRQED
jgi:hypothetical protein